jgi:hypothetical protein
MATEIQISQQLEIQRSPLGARTAEGVERWNEEGGRFKLKLTKAEQFWFKKHTGRMFNDS